MDWGSVMSGLNWQDCEFIKSAVKLDQYPKHDHPEIALAGRSNVGKSSLINCLVRRKRFARVSGEPGRTQTLNFYRVDRMVFVDLPGYGFAKVPPATRKEWGRMIDQYLQGRPQLSAILHIVDIRHKPSDEDLQMAEWISYQSIPSLIVATKADKLSRSRQALQAQAIAATMAAPVMPFSARTGLGRKELLSLLGNNVERAGGEQRWS